MIYFGHIFSFHFPIWLIFTIYLGKRMYFHWNFLGFSGVAFFATELIWLSSPSLNTFLICLDIVDLSLPNNRNICSMLSQTICGDGSVSNVSVIAPSTNRTTSWISSLFFMLLYTHKNKKSVLQGRILVEAPFEHLNKHLSFLYKCPSSLICLTF